MIFMNNVSTVNVMQYSMKLFMNVYSGGMIKEAVMSFYALP